MKDDPQERASKGGKARAALLSPEERKKIAIEAAEARWGKLPVAEHSGVLKLGDLELPCSVLGDGTRVLSEAGFTKALGRARSGSPWLPGADPGARMPHFAPPKSLISFIGDDLANELLKPIRYRSTIGGKVGYGVDANLIPGICEAWLKAREAGVLTRQQLKTAERAEILVRGLARVGIVALVDEATGYQKVREQRALAEILEKFVSKELKKWARRFPFEYYEELFRLKGWDTSDLTPNSPKPVEVGKITDDLVYKRLAPGVREELKRLTPRNEKGYLVNKLHQHLTDGIGNPKLEKHISNVLTVMKLSDDWYEFMRNMNKVLPPFGKNFELQLSD
jgi:hypothetical protein